MLGEMTVSSDETIIYFHQQFGYGDNFFSALDLVTGKKTDIQEPVSNIKMETNGNITLTHEDEQGNKTTKTYDKNLAPINSQKPFRFANPSNSSREYAFTSTQRVTEADLKTYSKAQLRIMRNEIFAVYGYIFKSGDLQRYLERKVGIVPSTKM